MEAIRVYDFVPGAETSAQPAAGTPTLDDDIVTLGYIRSNLSAKPAVSGTFASPNSIVAGTGIVFATLFPSATADQHEFIIFVKGSGGPVDISVNPQVTMPPAIGDKIILVGCNDTDTVKLESGNGLLLNQERFLAAGSVMILMKIDATTLVEIPNQITIP